MKYHTLFILSLLGLASCTDQLTEPQVCPEIICTLEFRTINVKFEDTAGNPLVVKDFSAIIKRTGKSINAAPAEDAPSAGFYTVATDSDRKELLPKGDTILVSASHPATQEKKTVTFVVSGGKCACHIEKISGPEKVVFN